MHAVRGVRNTKPRRADCRAGLRRGSGSENNANRERLGGDHQHEADRRFKRLHFISPAKPDRTNERAGHVRRMMGKASISLQTADIAAYRIFSCGEVEIILFQSIATLKRAIAHAGIASGVLAAEGVAPNSARQAEFEIHIQASCSPIGKVRILLPLAAWIALVSAAVKGGRLGSPMPRGGASLGTICVSIRAAARSIRIIG